MIRRLDADAKPQVLLSEAADARYIPTGHLAFMRQGTLFVVRFDPQTFAVARQPRGAVSNVAQSAAAWFADDLTMSGQFAISPEGVLAYVSSPSVSLPTSDVVRVNRRGDVSTLGAPPNTYRERVEVSPDGTTLAVTVQSTTDVRLFLYDMARGTLAPAFAQQAGRDTIRPVWSAKGHIAMHVYRSGGSHLASAERRSNQRCRRALVAAERIRAQFVAAQGDALIGQRDGDLWVYRPSASGENLSA